MRFRAAAMLGMVVVSGFALGTGACRDCGDCAKLAITLPRLVAKQAQPVSLELRQTDSETVLASCTWALSPRQFGIWTCTADSDHKTTTELNDSFYYDVLHPEKACTIVLTGPTGTQTIARAPTAAHDYSGEGYPGSCDCTIDDLVLTEDDLASVGAT